MQGALFFVFDLFAISQNVRQVAAEPRTLAAPPEWFPMGVE